MATDAGDIEGILRRHHFGTIFIALLIMAFVLAVLAQAAIYNAGISGNFGLSLIYNFILAISSALASLIIVSIVLRVFVVPYVAKATVEVLSPRDIPNALNDNYRVTKQYTFRGRSGRWFRAKVIPEISSRALATKVAHKIQIFLPDPSAAAMMQRYIEVKKVTEPGVAWDLTRGMAEIYATCVTALHHSISNPYLDVDVFFLPYLPLTRYDISDSAAILTSEKRECSAIKYERSSEFYDTLVEECRLDARLSERTYSSRNFSTESRKFDSTYVHEALTFLGCDQMVDDERFEKAVMNLAGGNNHPYLAA